MVFAGGPSGVGKYPHTHVISAVVIVSRRNWAPITDFSATR